MKIGIIGAGSVGLICAEHFAKMGAAISFYTNGLDIEPPSQNVIVKKHKVERVQKRFLDTDEVLKEGSRMRDLFRIFCVVEPGENVLSRVKENPEVFEKLGEEVIDSLSFSVESFEDVDVVIDASGKQTNPLMMGPGGGPAFNESKLKTEDIIFYGNDCFRNIDNLSDEEITIVGSSDEALLFLLKCEALLEKGNNINLVTSEASCFEKAYNSESLSLEDREAAKALIQDYIQKWKDACDVYTKEVQDWRGLPDFERRKVDPPSLPEPQLKIYESYSITSVDKLLDRDKLFLTLEMPSWRDPEGEKKPLMTLPQDKIFVLSGFGTPLRFDIGLCENEPGFYHVETLRKEVRDEELNNTIEKDLMRFFSKA